MGYWKNHAEIYKEYLPMKLGCQMVNMIEDADNVFKNAKSKNMADMLKAQLLAMKFNIAHFDIGDYKYIPGKTLDDLVAEADNLLCQNPQPTRKVLRKMKNLLDCLNNMHCFCYCPDGITDELNILQEGQATCSNASTCSGDDKVEEIENSGSEPTVNNDEEENKPKEKDLIPLPDLPEMPEIDLPKISIPEMPKTTTTPKIVLPPLPEIPDINADSEGTNIPDVEVPGTEVPPEPEIKPLPEIEPTPEISILDEEAEQEEIKDSPEEDKKLEEETIAKIPEPESGPEPETEPTDENIE